MTQKMDPMHEANVNELIDEMAKILKANCVKLYKSGGIDTKKYETCGFGLAKILLAASMEQCKDKFHPLSDDFRKDLRNLLHF